MLCIGSVLETLSRTTYMRLETLEIRSRLLRMYYCILYHISYFTELLFLLVNIWFVYLSLLSKQYNHV